jgi:hypothetical protein
MFRYGFTFIIVAGILLISCINNREKQVDPDAIYLDYMVSGDEQSNRIVTKLQYRLGGRNGDAVRLGEPAGVMMDGSLLSPDSTAFYGVYYEVISQADSFAGSHSINFIDAAGKKYPVNFDFPVFSMQHELPDTMDRRTGFRIGLKGLDSTVKLRIILTDTSFYGRGIERVDSVGSGQIIITSDDLEELQNGPVHLELIREEDKRLNPGPNKGGRLYLYYSIQREFMLQDSAR